MPRIHPSEDAPAPLHGSGAGSAAKYVRSEAVPRSGGPQGHEDPSATTVPSSTAFSSPASSANSCKVPPSATRDKFLLDSPLPPSSLSASAPSPATYRIYGRRWLVLLSVLLLNTANYSGWISFAAVTSKAAAFYRVSDSDIQLIVTVSYVLGIPACSAATYVFAKWGLRTSLLTGWFNCEYRFLTQFSARSISRRHPDVCRKPPVLPVHRPSPQGSSFN